jgi:hypothetical protein
LGWSPLLPVECASTTYPEQALVGCVPGASAWIRTSTGALGNGHRGYIASGIGRRPGKRAQLALEPGRVGMEASPTGDQPTLVANNNVLGRALVQDA